MTADYRLPEPQPARLASARSLAHSLGLRLVWSQHYQHAQAHGGRYRLLDGTVATFAADYMRSVEAHLRRLSREAAGG